MLDQIELLESEDFIDVFYTHLMRIDGRINSPKLRNKVVKIFLERIEYKYPELIGYTLEYKWFYLKNKMTEIPLCICGNKIKDFIKNSFCSHVCAMADATVRKKISIAGVGRVISKSQKEMMSLNHKKKWQEPDFRKKVINKMKLTNKDNGKNFLKEDGKPWNYGVTPSQETIEKQLKTKKERGIDFRGEKNPQYGKVHHQKQGEV